MTQHGAQHTRELPIELTPGATTAPEEAPSTATATSPTARPVGGPKNPRDTSVSEAPHVFDLGRQCLVRAGGAKATAGDPVQHALVAPRLGFDLAVLHLLVVQFAPQALLVSFVTLGEVATVDPVQRALVAPRLGFRLLVEHLPGVGLCSKLEALRPFRRLLSTAQLEHRLFFPELLRLPLGSGVLLAQLRGLLSEPVCFVGFVGEAALKHAVRAEQAARDSEGVGELTVPLELPVAETTPREVVQERGKLLVERGDEGAEVGLEVDHDRRRRTTATIAGGRPHSSSPCTEGASRAKFSPSARAKELISRRVIRFTSESDCRPCRQVKAIFLQSSRMGRCSGGPSRRS